MRMTGKRAIILTADQFRDEELFYPIEQLENNGWQVTVAAPKIEKLHGELGGTLNPHKTIDEVNPDEYDLLVIPGGRPGGAPAIVRDIKKAQEITKAFFAKNKPVASVCHGPWLLAAADVIDGRHPTSYWHDGVPEDVKKAGGIWEDKEVVVDGNLVTSRYPADLPAFMREVLKLVQKRELQI